MLQLKIPCRISYAISLAELLSARDIQLLCGGSYCILQDKRRGIIMSNNNDDFDFDDFLMFETIKGGGGCLVSALSIIGTIGFIIALII